jgi:hypothetical protein
LRWWRRHCTATRSTPTRPIRETPDASTAADQPTLSPICLVYDVIAFVDCRSAGSTQENPRKR